MSGSPLALLLTLAVICVGVCSLVAALSPLISSLAALAPVLPILSSEHVFLWSQPCQSTATHSRSSRRTAQNSDSS